MNLAQGETAVIEVPAGQRISRVRMLEGDLVMFEGQTLEPGMSWDPHGMAVRAVVVTALGAPAIVEYGTVAA